VIVACVSRAWVIDDQSLVLGLGLLKTREPSDSAAAVLVVSYSFVTSYRPRPTQSTIRTLQ